MYESFSFEVPEPMPDAPKPSTETVRHINLPDGKHWVKVRGGATQRESMYVAHLHKVLRTEYATDDERDEAIYTYNRGLATWLADRVVEHNLTYPGTEDKLPLGMELFYEMPGMEALNLIGHIQRPPSFFADPKAGTSSSGG